MFQFSGFPPVGLCIYPTVTEYCSAGFPHSEIRGSMDICSSPRLIAACHVLRRLLMPRHSPCTLFSLISFFVYNSLDNRLSFRLKFRHTSVSRLPIHQVLPALQTSSDKISARKSCVIFFVRYIPACLFIALCELKMFLRNCIP